MSFNDPSPGRNWPVCHSTHQFHQGFSLKKMRKGLRRGTEGSKMKTMMSYDHYQTVLRRGRTTLHLLPPPRRLLLRGPSGLRRVSTFSPDLRGSFYFRCALLFVYTQEFRHSPADHVLRIQLFRAINLVVPSFLCVTIVQSIRSPPNFSHTSDP